MLELQSIPLEKISPNPFQPRESFDKKLLEELADSMKSLDLLQPIVVRSRMGGYEIAAGERRWRAARMAGWDSIYAVVQDLDDETLQRYSLVENLHRLDLSSREKEKAVHDLWKSHYKEQGKDLRDLARDLGLSRTWVRDLVSAHEERQGLDIATEEAVTTSDLQLTRGIEKPVRKELLRKKATGEIAQRDLEEIAPIVKEAPPEKQKVIVEETTREIGEARRIVKEEAEAFARGEMEARDIGITLDADTKRLNRFLDSSNRIRYWTVAGVEMIGNERLRLKAVEYVEETRDHLNGLLEQLKRRNWYAR